MTTRPASIDELCARYDNENVHTEHVTSLALQLFDATRSWLDLPLPDRALLEAAARLHDVGYSVNPRQHPDTSAEIVLREGLKGFRQSQRARIAAAIPLHSKKRQPGEPHPLLERLPDPQPALRLGAILKVADGLDYGHIQDATILGVKRQGQIIEVQVRSPHFTANIEAGDRKADLWRSVFPLDIRFTLRADKDAPSLVRPGIRPLEAARRLTFHQFRTAMRNVDGALRGESIEPLHDIRVAIRRLCMVLKAFRKPLAATSARWLDQDLKQLNRALGPARDLDVWIDFLTSRPVQAQLKSNRRWAAFVAHQRELRRLQQATIRRYLKGPAFSALRHRFARFLRAELPRLTRIEPADSLEKLARNNLRKHLRRALKLARLRHSKSPRDLHRLRISLRKARYLGGFFSPLFGPPFDALTKRVHAVERALGRIHDADVGLARIRREGPPPPRLLVEHIQNRRNKAVQKLDKAWRRLENPKLQRSIRR